MNREFEWSESGELLLQMIDNAILTSGGATKMADLIVMENPEYFPVEEVNEARKRLREFDIKNILVKKSAAFEKVKPFIDRNSTEYFSQFKRSGRPKTVHKYLTSGNEYGFVQVLPRRPELR